MLRLLTMQHYRQLAVIVTFAAFAMQTLTMAAAQNPALTATTPKLINGALATAASATTNPLSNCSTVRSLFESQGINGADIPQQPITGKFCYFTHYFLSIITPDSIRIHFRNIPVYMRTFYIYLVGRSVGFYVSVDFFVFSNKMLLFLDIESDSIAYSKNFVSILLLSISVCPRVWTVQIFRVCVCFLFDAWSVRTFFPLIIFTSRHSLHRLLIYIPPLLSHFLVFLYIACICRIGSVQIPERSRMRVNTNFDFILV